MKNEFLEDVKRFFLFCFYCGLVLFVCNLIVMSQTNMTIPEFVKELLG